MQRLTSNEKLVLLVSIVGLIGGLVGLLIGQEVVLQIALLLLVQLIIVTAILITFRLDRIFKQQRKSRQEIYQVLYWLNGSDKRNEHQARKTRDEVRGKSEHLTKLIRELRSVSNSGKASQTGGKAALDTRTIDNLSEAERLRFNKLLAILDAHWDVLQRLDEDKVPTRDA